MSKVGDEGLDPRGKNLGRDFNGGILQGDRTVVVCMAGSDFFGDKDYVGHVQAPKIRTPAMEVI